MEIEYYKAAPKDALLLADFRIQFITELSGAQPEADVKILRNHLIAYFRTALAVQSYICIVAMHEKEPVGVGGMTIRQQPGHFKNPSGRVGYFMNMYTIPAFRKKGICTAILEKLTDLAKFKKIIAFELHATKDAEDLYRKNGFEMHREPTYRKYLKYEEELDPVITEPDKRLLSVPLIEFGLSTRARNLMNSCKIHTLGDLVQWNPRDLLMYRNFGKASLAELEGLLHSKGFRFGMSLDELQNNGD